MPLRLFGALTLTTIGGAVVNPPTRKTALALGVLGVLGDKGAAREALAEWVWPDRSEAQAKSSLRQALAAIRKLAPETLPGFELEADRDTVRLTGPDDGVDMRAFEAALAGGGTPGQQRAADLYQGDLCESAAAPPALEAMLGAHRARLRAVALKLVETLSERCLERGGGCASCEALANRLLAGDPTAEEAHRALIRLRLVEGQLNAARKQLERCAEAVARELGVAPEPATTALIETAATPALEAPAPSAAATTAPTALRGDLRGPRPSLVVLPFEELGPPRDDFFVDGVNEEITAALSRVKDFFVIARQSAYTYKGRFVDVRQVGAELGVRYCVEGVVRRGGDRLRITVQLVDTETGVQLWSDRYEGDLADVFDLQDNIASHVAGAINPSVRASEIERAKHRPPEDLEAYDLTLRGLPHFWSHRREDNRVALAFFDQALEHDPDYSAALAFKGWAHGQQACYLWTDDPARERASAEAAATKAARHVGEHATALVAIGAAISMSTSDYAAARDFIDRGLAIDPNNAWGWMRLGWLRVFSGDHADAAPCFDRALELSPFDPFAFNMLFGKGAALAQLGDLDAAIALTERGLRHGPGVTWAHRMLAAYHALAGDQERAAEALATFLRHYPSATLKQMKASLPPGMTAHQARYWDGIRRAGFPEG